MSKNPKLILTSIDFFVFDFDGVLTSNMVYIDQDGKELVRCSRSDGLAFNVLNKLNKTSCIISTEKNAVVTARAKKLKTQVLQGVAYKEDALKDVALQNNVDLSRVLYVGNDLNDYNAMRLCGVAVCPSDSHSSILNIADIVLNSRGGNGIVRELLEDFFMLDFNKILYTRRN